MPGLATAAMWWQPRARRAPRPHRRRQPRRGARCAAASSAILVGGQTARTAAASLGQACPRSACPSGSWRASLCGASGSHSQGAAAPPAHRAGAFQQGQACCNKNRGIRQYRGSAPSYVKIASSAPSRNVIIQYDRQYRLWLSSLFLPRAKAPPTNIIRGPASFWRSPRQGRWQGENGAEQQGGRLEPNQEFGSPSCRRQGRQ